MKDYTFITAKADKDSGVSIVRIGTDLGEFEGIAECLIEDMDYFSNYFGCRIAELRALVKYAKAKVKYYKAQLGALRNFKNTMQDTRNWSPNDFYWKKLEQHIAETQQQILHWMKIRDSRQDAIRAAIKERDVYNEKMRGNKNDFFK